jgi:hypothetical protein
MANFLFRVPQFVDEVSEKKKEEAEYLVKELGLKDWSNLKFISETEVSFKIK